VAFSPDGKYLLAGSQDKTVYLWEVQTVEDLLETRVHQDWVTAVVFSPDGKRMASASWDGTFRLRDTTWRDEPRRFGKGHGRFLALAFAPRGNLLASLSQNKGISLWDLETGQETRVLGEEQHRALCLAFSPDGRMLAAGSKDGTIRIWETASGKELQPLGDSPERVTSLSFSPDGKALASGSKDGSITIWNTAEQIEQQSQIVKLAREDLERLWSDLGGSSAPQANRALWLLSRAPGQSVPFLKGKLRPITVDRPHIVQLVTELDSPKFSRRQEATRELELLGKFAEPALRQALRARPALEVRRRVEGLLARVEGERCVPYPDARRAGRALKALARMESPDAQVLLKSLAAGAAESWLTQEAKATLDRLRFQAQKRQIGVQESAAPSRVR
jgi:dipeptidyl aminopeptidase/acylaminoacyl peptidase